MFQCFGAARELALLRTFAPVLTTRRVQREQGRTAPAHARAAFGAAVQAGWIGFVEDAAREEVEAVLLAAPGLSWTDAELFVLARDAGDDLFTDETLLARFAEKQGVTVYDVVDAILLVEELGGIDEARKKRLVFSMHAEDGRTFTPTDLDALKLRGFL